MKLDLGEPVDIASWGVLRGSLGVSFGVSIRASLWVSFKYRLRESLWDSLRDSLWESLEEEGL